MEPRKKLTFTQEVSAAGPSRSKRARSPVSYAISPRNRPAEPRHYEPPPKRYRPLAPEDRLAADNEEFELLEALYFEEVRDKYTDLEMSAVSIVQEQAHQIVDKDAKCKKN